MPGRGVQNKRSRMTKLVRLEWVCFMRWHQKRYARREVGRRFSSSNWLVAGWVG